MHRGNRISPTVPPTDSVESVLHSSSFESSLNFHPLMHFVPRTQLFLFFKLTPGPFPKISRNSRRLGTEDLLHFPLRCRRGEGLPGERAGQHVRKRMRARFRGFPGLPGRDTSGGDPGAQESSDAREFHHLELVRPSNRKPSGAHVATTLRRGSSALETVS